MATVRDLINGSMRLIGALASGETASAEEAAEALESLNGMIEGWNLERLMTYAIERIDHTLTAGQQNYTIGVGGDINVPRPLRINEAYIKIPGTGPNLELPVQIVTDEEWAGITLKSTSSSIPWAMLNGNEYPLSVLSLWPVPDTANGLVLYVWSQINGFASINDTIVLPPGYLKALRYNLATELAPEYGAQISPAVAAIANDAKADIKRLNLPTMYMSFDDALLQRIGNKSADFNVLTGY